MGTGPLEGSTLTALGSAVAAFLVSIATYSWRARGLVTDLEKRIEERAGELRKEAAERQDDNLRLTGEGLAALRQKATDMELWSRDNFVRRADFQNAVNGFTRSNDDVRAEIKGLRSELKEEIGSLRDLMLQIIQGKVGPHVPHR